MAACGFWVLSAILVLLIIPSCKDFNFYEDVLDGSSDFTWERNRPETGILNPNNPNELIYRWTDSSLPGPRYELRKRNLLKGEDQPLLEDVWGEVSWSNNGWLALRRTDNQVWVMRDDGSQLERLSQSFLDRDIATLAPSISPDGKEIVFYYSDSSSYIGIIDRKTGRSYNLIDNIYSPSDPEFSPNGNRIAYCTDKYNKETNIIEAQSILHLYNYKTKESKKICELPEDEPIYRSGGISWKGNDEVVVNTNKYVYLIDINTGEWKRIFEHKQKISLIGIQPLPSSNYETFFVKVIRVKQKKLGEEEYGNKSLEIWSFDDMKKVEELIP